jgi:hypothetical protein
MVDYERRIEEWKQIACDKNIRIQSLENELNECRKALKQMTVRIPANVTGHSGDRDRFAHGHHAGVGFVL